MNKDNIWTNQAFCFRLSLIFILVWLTLSSTISLVVYLSFNDDPTTSGIILEFSTWFFVIPAITGCGLINAIPLIIDWLLESTQIKNQDEITTAGSKKDKRSTSYSQLSSKLEKPQHEETQSV